MLNGPELSLPDHAFERRKNDQQIMKVHMLHMLQNNSTTIKSQIPHHWRTLGLNLNAPVKLLGTLVYTGQYEILYQKPIGDAKELLQSEPDGIQDVKDARRNNEIE